MVRTPGAPRWRARDRVADSANEFSAFARGQDGLAGERTGGGVKLGSQLGLVRLVTLERLLLGALRRGSSSGARVRRQDVSEPREIDVPAAQDSRHPPTAVPLDSAGQERRHRRGAGALDQELCPLE